MCNHTYWSVIKLFAAYVERDNQVLYYKLNKIHNLISLTWTSLHTYRIYHKYSDRADSVASDILKKNISEIWILWATKVYYCFYCKGDNFDVEQLWVIAIH